MCYHLLVIDVAPALREALSDGLALALSPCSTRAELASDSRRNRVDVREPPAKTDAHKVEWWCDGEMVEVGTPREGTNECEVPGNTRTRPANDHLERTASLILPENTFAETTAQGAENARHANDAEAILRTMRLRERIARGELRGVRIDGERGGEGTSAESDVQAKAEGLILRLFPGVESVPA
jgi:hypothetical protein